MIIKDLGAVSAYAYAVEKGYTGTEEEFATLMASYATVAEEAAESAESASASATSASASASTATTKASEASTAAQTATAKAEEAQADADAAALDASQALSAASTATSKASEAAQSASDAATAKTAAQTAQTAAEGSATTAQTAAQTATQKAAEAAESARTLTIDTTLTQSGQAADAAAVGLLKSAIGDSRYSTKKRSDWIKINSTESFASGDVVYIKPLSLLNVTGDIVIYGFVGTTSTNLGYVAPGKSAFITLSANYDYLQTAYHLTAVDDGTHEYVSIIAKVGENGTIGGTMLGNLNRILSLETNEQMYNSPFSVAVPDSISGIIAVNIYDKLYATYQGYRFKRVTHNSSWYMYAELQGYDGSSWVNIDAWEISASAATSPQPVIELLDSKYHRATMTVVWANIGTSINLTNQDFRLKDSVINLPQIDISTVANQAYANATIPPFELTDHVDRTKVVKVKQDGTGDYTTIGAAYAAITDSAFDNQYEIIVYPGTYNENNLVPPPYTHTHGIYPMQTIVDSTGTGEDEIDNSVFDQRFAPSKLSNMWIKSATKYCVHQDVELYGITLVNENLYCEKLPGGSQLSSVCVGMGADFGGAKFVWRGCTFVNGEVGIHTNPNQDPNANQHLIFEDCTFVNAYLWLGVAGNTLGEYVCQIDNCKTNKGNSGLRLKFGAAVSGLPVNFPWQIIGGNNNFAPVFDNTSDTSVVDDWKSISTTEKVYVIATASITKGKYVTDSGTIANALTPKQNILGIAVDSGTSGDCVPVWTGAIPYTGTQGEYGIDANGDLSASASIKIGYVLNNIFYPLH